MRISSEDQCEKRIQRAPEKRLKRDYQQRESELNLLVAKKTKIPENLDIRPKKMNTLHDLETGSLRHAL